MKENISVATDEAPSSRPPRVSLEDTVPLQGVADSSGATKNSVSSVANAPTATSIVELLEDLLSSSSKKVKRALDALNEMKLDHYSNSRKREEFFTLGGDFSVIQAMKKYPCSKTIQWKACQLLKLPYPFSCRAKEEAFAKLGGVQVLLDTMKRHVAIERVQAAACGVLMNVTRWCDENRKTVVELGGAEAIIKAMGNFPGAVDLQEDAVTALVHLIKSHAGKPKILSLESAVSAVAGARKQHTNSSQIRRKGLHFKLMAETYEATMNDIRDAGGITAIA